MSQEIRTRSGRISKPPTRYEPVEKVEDDYGTDDYDDVESDISSNIAYSDEELDEDDDDLSFVESDKSESEEEDNGRHPLIPVKKRRGPTGRPRGATASPRAPHAFPNVPSDVSDAEN